LDKALEDYFLIQLAMLANTKVNAYVTIAEWKKAGLRLPAEDMPRRENAGAITCHTTETRIPSKAIL
jgi:hypothetical protein